ncbi:MAG: hypothetical protein AAF533_11590, partial [Acidobacteriota bacterium]
MRKSGSWLLIAGLLVGGAVTPRAQEANLLRNDQVTSLRPITPPLVEIFTDACSTDPTVRLDRADPSDCSSSVEGEGGALSSPGSDDRDDLYVLGFDTAAGPVPDPETGLLDSSERPLIFYQVEFACGLLFVSKDPATGSILLDHEECDAPTGACCDAMDACTDDVTQADCEGAGGTYVGDDTTCAADPCTPTGACCNTMDACTDDVTQADCEGAGGTYLGDDTTCAGDPCTPTGACCNTMGGCDADVTQAACEGGGGTYLGDDTTCAADPCTPTGACCNTMDACTDDVTQADCEGAGGTYLGDDTTCAG